MLYKIGETDDPKEYNGRIAESRYEAIEKGYSTGCVGARACEGCKSIIADSICLCIPSFICPECGFDNGVEYRKIMGKFSFTPRDGIFNLSSDSLPLLSLPSTSNFKLNLRGNLNEG